jgi:hypothetical protein
MGVEIQLFEVVGGPTKIHMPLWTEIVNIAYL